MVDPEELRAQDERSTAPPGWSTPAGPAARAVPPPAGAPGSSWALFAQTMLLVGGFALVLLAGIVAGRGGNPITGTALFIGGGCMLLMAVIAHVLTRGVAGALWITASLFVIGLGLGPRPMRGTSQRLAGEASAPASQIADAGPSLFAIHAIGIAITITFAAALYGALRAPRDEESWTLTLSIGAVGALIVAWLYALTTHGPPAGLSVLIGGLSGALVVAQFVRLRETVTTRDPVWFATHVIVLMVSVLATRGSATGLGRAGGPTARPAPGAFRKL